MSLEDMAKAHLSNVQKAIGDLEKQKENIQQEIDKLSEYFSKGLEELNADVKQESSDNQ
jgi:predicted  nucleic acid-binding Zn-ribbon protein